MDTDNNSNNSINNLMVINKPLGSDHENQTHLSLVSGKADTGPGIGTLGGICRSHNANHMIIPSIQPLSCGIAASDSGIGVSGRGGGGAIIHCRI